MQNKSINRLWYFGLNTFHSRCKQNKKYVIKRRNDIIRFKKFINVVRKKYKYMLFIRKIKLRYYLSLLKLFYFSK